VVVPGDAGLIAAETVLALLCTWVLADAVGFCDGGRLPVIESIAMAAL
jgi:hypothetical protein